MSSKRLIIHCITVLKSGYDITVKKKMVIYLFGKYIRQKIAYIEKVLKELLQKIATKNLVRYLYPPNKETSFNSLTIGVPANINLHKEAPFPLIFLISMPRSGSTLLQKLLSNNPRVYSYSEGWMLLPLIYITVPNSIERAVWEQSSVIRAIEEQTNIITDGKQCYFRGVREMVFSIYGELLENTCSEVFIDKTPSYYMISHELRKIFPESKQIILLRHPLDIISSMFRTWLYDNRLHAHKHKHTLLYGIFHIKKAIERGEYTIRYEDLVANPGYELQRIMHFIGLDYKETYLHYNNNPSSFTLGDNDGVYRNNKPNVYSVGKWKSMIHVPQYWRIFSDYLNYLGECLFENLGYDFKESYDFLDNTRPTHKELKNTIPLKQLLARQDGTCI